MRKHLFISILSIFCAISSFPQNGQGDDFDSSSFALRINTGGSETIYNGNTFIADSYSDTGSTLDRPQTGLNDPFKTFRFSRSQQMAYNIPLADGEYTVNLYFAELWFGATGGGTGGTGSRIFDVRIEGQLVEDNLDVFAEVGADASLMKSYTVTIAGGVMNIDFDSRDEVGGERHPIINAIEILSDNVTVPTIQIDAIPNQQNEINDVINLSVSASENGSNADLTYEIAGQPLGVQIDATTGFISGTIAESAATGGLSNNGLHEVTVVVSKVGFSDSSMTFTWTIAEPACTLNSLPDANINRFEGISQKIEDKLYIFGGFTFGVKVVPETEIYDATNDTYSFGAPMPIPSTHIAAVAMDTEIWILGGFVGDNPGVATDAVQVYDVINDSWFMGPALPKAIGSGAGARIGNKIHFFGGLLPDRQTDVEDHWILDLDNVQAGWTAAAPMPNARNHHSGIALNGLVYAIGGQTGHDGPRADTKFVHAYDPGTDQWTRLADLARPRSHFKAATTIHNGKIIIAGGVDNGPLVNDVTEYEPVSDTWIELCKLPGEGLEEGAAQAFGNRLIISGGRPVRDANIMLKTTRWLQLEGATSLPPIADAGANQSITLPTNSISIIGSGFDPDGGAVSFQWTQVSGPNMAILTDTGDGNLNASNLENGVHVFRLTVTDDENDTSFDDVTITVNSEPTEVDFELRINAGGTDTNYNGETFVADTYFNTGSTLDRPQTGLTEPFQTFRFSRSEQMSYNIPLADGEYTVNLYFAELWFGATGGGSGGVGSRVFDVSIEGELVEDNLDVFAQAGADAMVMKSHTISVTGGLLDINFDSRAIVGGKRHPIINAIEILGSVDISFPPIADAGVNQQITLPANSVVLNGTGNDPDGGQVTSLWTQESGPTDSELTGNNTFNLTVGNLVEGEYVFRLTVTDDENDTSFDEVLVTVDPEVISNPSDFALRINTGGAQTDFDGETFIADTFFDNGSVLDRPQTGLPEPFQTFRFSRSQQMAYDIPLEDGEYTVNLYFAELWFGATGGGPGGVGSRVFDVSIEDEIAEDNLDIFAEVGADAMLVKNYTVTVVGGELNIDFDSRNIVGGERHPVINAIEILGDSGENLESSNFQVQFAITNPSIVSPNPAVNSTELIFENPIELTQVQVFDISGRLVYDQKGSELGDDRAYLLNVADLETGIYFIKSWDSEGNSYKKRMVIKK